ncbi:MAG: hypothetical protein M1305_06205 [Candidatus Marsarchaeota archaeon]|nr:hypothetical protein [Candidatus Marsarchaeota archaeon]
MANLLGVDVVLLRSALATERAVNRKIEQGNLPEDQLALPGWWQPIRKFRRAYWHRNPLWKGGDYSRH